MNNEQYLQTQSTLTTAAALIADLDLEGFLNRMAAADTVGAFTDPTLYRKALADGGLNKLRNIAGAALRLKNEVIKAREG
jgi:hypothetical protein